MALGGRTSPRAGGVYTRLVRSNDELIPRLFESQETRLELERKRDAELSGQVARVEAATTIFVTADGGEPIHVALLGLEGRRVFAKLDRESDADQPVEQVLAGQKVKFLVKDDGDHYFQVDRGRSRDFGRLVDRLRSRLSRGGDTVT